MIFSIIYIINFIFQITSQPLLLIKYIKTETVHYSIQYVFSLLRPESSSSLPLALQSVALPGNVVRRSQITCLSPSALHG